MSHKIHSKKHSATEVRQLKKDKKKLQEQLLEAERMSSLGEISGYIAHEIKNYASVILSTSREAKYSKSASPSDIDLALKVGIEASEKLLNLSKSISDYFRGATTSFSMRSPQEVLENTILLMQNSLKKSHITIEKRFKAKGKVCCDANQLQQVFINLILNAKDAIGNKKKGKITFETEQNKNYVVLKITDNGSGMTEAVKKKAFNPFFSTKKKKGHNAGIGLSVCRDIVVKRHMGKLRLISKLGKGTSFQIHLNRHHRFK